jgi:hypothetical protein
MLWCAGAFLPRMCLGWAVRKPPVVYSFNAGPGRTLGVRTRNVNTFAATKACFVFTRHGSDKGRLWHNYTTVYSALFAGDRDRKLRIFELGLGTNNAHLVSSMGTSGRPGASLRAWRELFPKASIFGADIDRDILFTDEHITTYYCDQTNPAEIRNLWLQVDMQGGMDILIEDGLHTLEANISFLDGSLQHLRPGGYYVIEDIKAEYIEEWRRLLDEKYAKSYPDHEFALVVLPNAFNKEDNNMLIISRAEAG